jgi:predicted ATPase/DNA-binding CsgD family transcriptional regulator
MAAIRSLESASSMEGNDGASIGPLPFAITSLVGRSSDVEAVVERLRSPFVRLLTLIGPGGIGKTRLALESASLLRAEFADGVQLIRLAPVRDPDHVPTILARALGLPTDNADPQLWSRASDRHLLLVIDNFEQLLPAAPWLVQILSHCPKITMLVTSRERLNLSGEHEYRVPTLETPAEERGHEPDTVARSEAVQLFLQRAQAVQPAFALNAENAGVVAQLTRQLDGLPLAIELAAAQCKYLSPAAILERLSRAGDALEGGPIDLPPHQRSLRTTIAWSQSLLEPQERDVFHRLAVFAGGFQPQAAAYVCDSAAGEPQIDDPDAVFAEDAPILATCISLSEKSLISPASGGENELRFSMLVTIRSFGLGELERQGALDTVAGRHAAWFRSLAVRAASESHGSASTTWLDRLQTEHANLSVALEWYAKQGDATAVATMANALSTYWQVRGYVDEGSRWMQTAIALDGFDAVDPAPRADMLCRAGWLALRQGRSPEMRAYGEESLAIALAEADHARTGAALRLLGEIEDRAANHDRARELVTGAYEAYLKAEHPFGIADALTCLGGLALDSGDLDLAVARFHEALGIATPTGDNHLLARIRSALGVTLYNREEYQEATVCHEWAREVYRAHGDVRGYAVATDNIGKNALRMGDIERAWACHREALTGRWNYGDPRGVAVWLEAVSDVLGHCEAFEDAAMVLGAAMRVREMSRLPHYDSDRRHYQRNFDRIRRGLPPRQFDEAWKRGEEMRLRELVEHAVRVTERAVKHHEPVKPAPSDRLAKFGLTAREREIADLLALRLSDREIADRLSISHRTVGAHVTVILGKLGISSRREIAGLMESTGQGSARSGL